MRASFLVSRKREAVAFALFAAVPVLFYLVRIARDGVPRFETFGDFALLEHATREVWHGHTLRGPYSRFGWCHPGPLYFYVLAPFQAAFGDAATGLYVGTCAIAIGSAGTLVAELRLAATRTHALIALVVVLGWFAAFGNVAANPWNPLVVVLPLMCFLVTTALFATGRTSAVYPSVVTGALVFQTHVATVTSVALAGAGAFGVWWTARSRPRPVTGGGRQLLGAAALLFVLFAPAIVELATAGRGGNAAQVVRFFLHRETPLRPLKQAVDLWVAVTAWLPERAFGRAIASEGPLPLVMRWDSVDLGPRPSARAIAVVHWLALAAGGAIAWRRRDRTSFALVVVASAGNVIAIGSLRALIGPECHYLVFWTTAASTVGWLGAFASFAAALRGALARWPRARRLAARGAIGAGIGALILAVSMQLAWLRRHPPETPSSRPEIRQDFVALYGDLRRRLASERATPIVHFAGAWDVAEGLVLELSKDHVDVRVDDRERWVLPSIRGPEPGLGPVLHVYAAPGQLPVGPCLELLTTRGDFALHVSPTPADACHDAARVR